MTSTQQPIDRQTFYGGVLTITACILLVAWFFLAYATSPALGIGQSDRGGDYIMLTQQISTSQEAVVVVDAASKRMLLYAFDYNNRQVVMLDGFDLSRLRGAAKDGAKDGDDREIKRDRRKP